MNRALIIKQLYCAGALLVFFSLFLVPTVAHAQIIPACNPVPGQGEAAQACVENCTNKCGASGACIDQCTQQCGGAGSGLPTCGINHLIELLANIYNFLLTLAGLVAMFFIVFGGMRMLYFSYMEDSSQELEAAKFTVRRAIGGFIIIAMAYLLVNTLLSMLGVDESSIAGKLLLQFGLLKKS